MTADGREVMAASAVTLKGRSYPRGSARVMKTGMGMVFMFFLVHAAWAQTTWHVDDDRCPDRGSGTPQDPFCRIQDAIDAANDEDTVLVAPGLYLDPISFDGKNLTLVSAEGPDETVIDGQFGGSVVSFRAGEGRNAVIDGFTLMNGTGEVSGSVYVGGGVSCFRSSPTIRNNLIIGNVASFGGGIDCEESNPLILNNVITGNEASDTHLGTHISGDGGGVSVFNGDAEINGNIIYDNVAERNGGAFLMDGSVGDGHVVYYRNNLMFDNVAHHKGGAVYMWGAFLLNFSGCTATENTAEEAGDGVYAEGNSSAYTLIENSILHGNGAAFGDGNELYVRTGHVGVRYTDVRAGLAGVTVDEESGGILFWDTNNLDAAPMFLDAEADDFHLDPCSPLVDVGNPDFKERPNDRDIDGQDRTLGTIDLGADEVDEPCQDRCTGDERIKKAKCKQKNGENTLKVKLVGGVAGDTFDVILSSGQSRSGTLAQNGSGNAKFKRLPSGNGTATVTWGCGFQTMKDYGCP